MPSLLPLRAPAALILPLTLVLAGCIGTSAGYPSLAPRPIESMSLAEPARPAASPAVADPAAVTRYAPIIKQARVDDVAFADTLNRERPILDRGRTAPEGSDAWTAAQTSLSRLVAARAPVARALSELDAARSAPPTETNTGEALAAQQAFDEVQQIDRQEATALSALWPSPN